MRTESELRELHGRLVKALSHAKSIKIPYRDLRELIQVKVQIEWILGDHTASSNFWEASLLKALVNLEDLRKTYERSVQAGNN